MLPFHSTIPEVSQTFFYASNLMSGRVPLVVGCTSVFLVNLQQSAGPISLKNGRKNNHHFRHVFSQNIHSRPCSADVLGA